MTRLRWELQYHKRVVRMGQLHTRTYLRWGKYKELEMQFCYEALRKMMEWEFVREDGDNVARKINDALTEAEGELDLRTSTAFN